MIFQHLTLSDFVYHAYNAIGMAPTIPSYPVSYFVLISYGNKTSALSKRKQSWKTETISMFLLSLPASHRPLITQQTSVHCFSYLEPLALQWKKGDKSPWNFYLFGIWTLSSSLLLGYHLPVPIITCASRCASYSGSRSNCTWSSTCAWGMNIAWSLNRKESSLEDI